MQPNENHFGRVTFPFRMRAARTLPPPPQQPLPLPPSHPPTRTANYSTRPPPSPHRHARLAPHAHSAHSSRPPRERLAKCYETRRRRRWPRGRDGYTGRSVGRRPITRRREAGRGALGVRRLDVIDPNRPHTPLPTTLRIDPKANGRVRACVHVYHVTAFFTARFAFL